MRTRSKLLLAAIAAIALFGIAVQSASASRLSIAEREKGFKIVWTALELEAAGSAVRCPVTMEGTFEVSSLVKRAGTRIGAVTRASVRGEEPPCTGGTATVLTATLPWAVTYQGFGGTLPTITSMKLALLGMSLQIRLAGVTCLMRTEIGQPFLGEATVSSGKLTRFTALREAEFETSGGFFCSLGGKAHFGGTGTETGLEGGAGPTLQLIEQTTTPPSLSPSPVSFGTVETSSTTERTVTIEAGSEALTVNNISMTTGTSYSIADPNSCRGARLAARGRCSFSVTFRAPAELARTVSDTINVETSVRALTDSVSGSTPRAIATPSPVEFGRLPVNSLARREVTITAGVEATIESIRMRSGTRFSITDPNRCIGTRLAANGRCTFNVIVETPAESERALEDTILIGTSALSIEDRVRAST